MPYEIAPAQGILQALGQYGQVNRENALRREEERRARQRMLATVAGIGVGALAGPAAVPGLSALQGAAYGGAAGGAFANRDPAGFAMAGLGAAGAGQAGQDRQSALDTGRTVASMIGNMRAPASPEAAERNNLLGAYGALAQRDPAGALHGAVALRGGDMALRAAAAKQAFEAQQKQADRDVTTRGQDLTATTAGVKRATEKELGAARIEADKFIADMKLKDSGESTDRMRARLMTKVLEGTAVDVEKQALIRLERADPFSARRSQELTPAFAPRGQGGGASAEAEAKMAHDKIKLGADATAVKLRYKERWGVDLP